MLFYVCRNRKARENFLAHGTVMATLGPASACMVSVGVHRLVHMGMCGCAQVCAGMQECVCRCAWVSVSVCVG